ncbi:MAG: hypothetical protein V7603_6869 [Micromonosporaceae bacterium]|jgi:alkanesulfonate monooxygenase SsuD/methylene tetrahydromethanopterin reductase-like flavin-dependent oxidoreductase (luciferase family)
MKLILFAQAPYQHLPEDFEHRFESAVTTPYSLTTAERVCAAYQDLMEILLHGARCGFDGLAMTEHSQSPSDMVPNPDLIASALAYVTEAAGLDVAICPVGRSLGKSREPVRVAEECAMIDVMSRGRLVAGFPVGLAYDACINNGIPPLAVRGRFEEGLDLVLRAWQDPHPFAWNGRHGQYPSVNIWPRPVQQPRPPVSITGIGNPRTMATTFERDLGFTYFGWFGANLTGGRVFERFWEIGERAGVARNPYRLSFLQTIAVAETDEQAARDYGRHVEYFFRKNLGALRPEMIALPGGIDINGVRALLRDPGDLGMVDKMRDATFDQLRAAGAVIAGSPETVRDGIAQFAAEYGIGNLYAQLSFGSLPRDLAMRNVSLFAEQVAPALRGLWAEHDHHWWPRRLGGAP